MGCKVANLPAISSRLQLGLPGTPADVAVNFAGLSIRVLRTDFGSLKIACRSNHFCNSFYIRERVHFRVEQQVTTLLVVDFALQMSWAWLCYRLLPGTAGTQLGAIDFCESLIDGAVGLEAGGDVGSACCHPVAGEQCGFDAVGSLEPPLRAGEFEDEEVFRPGLGSVFIFQTREELTDPRWAGGRRRDRRARVCFTVLGAGSFSDLGPGPVEAWALTGAAMTCARVPWRPGHTTTSRNPGVPCPSSPRVTSFC